MRKSRSNALCRSQGRHNAKERDACPNPDEARTKVGEKKFSFFETRAPCLRIKGQNMSEAATKCLENISPLPEPGRRSDEPDARFFVCAGATSAAESISSNNRQSQILLCALRVDTGPMRCGCRQEGRRCPTSVEHRRHQSLWRSCYPISPAMTVTSATITPTMDSPPNRPEATMMPVSS